MSPELEAKIGRTLSMHTGINTGLVVTGEVNVERVHTALLETPSIWLPVLALLPEKGKSWYLKFHGIIAIGVARGIK